MKKRMIIIYFIAICLSFTGVFLCEKSFEKSTMKIPSENIYPSAIKMELYAIGIDIFDAWLKVTVFSLLLFSFFFGRQFHDIKTVRGYFFVNMLAILCFPIVEMLLSWIRVFFEEVLFL